MMNNKIRLGLLLIILFSLFGCDFENNGQKTMPIDMPSDFDFIVKFGINKKNEINTYDNTVTKDLVANGTTTTSLQLSNDEMALIYNKMREINFTDTKQFIPKKNCFQEPNRENEWIVTLNGEIIKHYISEEFCKPTADAKRMMELRDYVFSFVVNKEEYKSLPEANGAYQ